MDATYVVSGLTCQHCVGHVLTEIRDIPGVLTATLDIHGHLVVSSETAIDFAAIVAGVSAAGDYSVSPNHP